MKNRTLHRTIGRPLDRPLSTFNIGKALVDLKTEEAFTREGRNAIILHKEDGLKVVLMAMREGNCIQSHKAQTPITVHLLEGSVQFNTEKESLRLGRGDLLTLRAGVAHDVKALEDSAFILTLAGTALSADRLGIGR
jgi:quercetin dioxygenase-like cupin family protein